MDLKNICTGVLGLTVFLAGCSDKMDYHEYTYYDQDYVFSDFGNTAGFVNNIYAYLDEDMPDLYSMASACDEAEMAVTYSSVLDYTNGRWTALNTDSYFGYYTPIRAANYYLEYATDLDFEELQYTESYEADMAKYRRHEYEVRLLRAYFYFLLVRAYGDVPFTTQVLSADEANALERTAYDEVFDFIVSECDAVSMELPVSYEGLENDASGGNSNPETGRVNRGMALALKARALLYRASPLFNVDGNAGYWHDAAVACKEVIDYCAENGIVLGSYEELWGADSYNASEMIFVRRIGSTNSPEIYNFPTGMENAYGGNCPTQTLVDAYQRTDGTYLTVEEAVSQGYDDPYENLDPRFGYTIAHNGEEWPSTNPNGTLQTYTGGANGQPVAYATPTGYYLKKYLDGTLDISSSSSSGGNYHNWITFRLGEFYLDYAEAVFNCLGTADATSSEFDMSAREAVNVVRNRPGVDMPDLPSGMGNDEFWNIYKKERMVELAFEGHRFWDVRRWKEGGFDSLDRMQITLEDEGNYTYTRVTKPLTWNDCMYFYPIPDSELRINPNLVQNEGW